jgi:hypothetical protein
LVTSEIEVSAPQEEILVSTKQRNLALAGQGGGKSHIAGLLSADFVINYPFVRGFIGANTYSQLAKSTLDRVFQVWLNTFGWAKGKQFVVDVIPPKHFKQLHVALKSYENTICFDNGAVIFTASLDNYKMIDGTQFGWGILDETKDTKEEAVKEVITGRLRESGMWVKDGVVYTDHKLGLEVGAEPWNPLYILTSPAKVYWINEWFELSDKYDEISNRIFSETDYYSLQTSDKHVVIYSSYHNQNNLPANYIEQRKKDLAGNQNLIEMLVYGSPIAKSGGEMFSEFKRLRHVRPVEFSPCVSIHVSLDFNVVPYISMTCWQIINKNGNYSVRAFDEIALSSPRNKTEELCKELERKYLQEKKCPLFFYGDASGKNQSTVSLEHNYDILERVLSRYLNDNSNRVIKKNPSVVASRDFTNKILADGYSNIELIIDPKCKKLILDLEFLKEGPDGGKLIERTKDPVTGQTYEKYGHMSDTLRYFLISAFSNLYKPE